MSSGRGELARMNAVCFAAWYSKVTGVELTREGAYVFELGAEPHLQVRLAR